MPLRLREVKGITVMDIDGNIDINSSEIIETVGWLVNSGKLNIILNLENVDLVDYSGLSILAVAYKNVLNHKGKLKFLKAPLSVSELFKLVKLDSVFSSYPDEESAINSFYETEVEHMHLRRKFKRLDIHLKVSYNIPGSREHSFEGNALNISGAGVYIYTHDILPLGTSLELKFFIPDTPHMLETEGRVVWLSDKELQPHSYPGMGVAFSHLSAEKERIIIDFIDKNLTHRADEPF